MSSKEDLLADALIGASRKTLLKGTTEQLMPQMLERAEAMAKEHNELLKDMRELLATCNDHSSYLALDSLAALRMTIRALREKWGEK